MSKLIEKLKRVAGGEAQGMGFVPPAARGRVPSLTLLGSLSSKDVEATAGLDALIFPWEELREEKGSLDALEIPWGIWLESPEQEKVKRLQEMGCDFLLFSMQAPASSIPREGSMGRVLQVEASLDDSLVRSLDQLPLDALLITGMAKGEPTTLHDLMLLRRWGNLTRRFLLLEVGTGLEASDLEGLRGAGIQGIVVPLPEMKETLSALRQAINALPPLAHSRSIPSPLLPTARELPTPPEEEFQAWIHPKKSVLK